MKLSLRHIAGAIVSLCYFMIVFLLYTQKKTPSISPFHLIFQYFIDYFWFLYWLNTSLQHGLCLTNKLLRLDIKHTVDLLYVPICKDVIKWLNQHKTVFMNQPTCCWPTHVPPYSIQQGCTYKQNKKKQRQQNFCTHTITYDAMLVMFIYVFLKTFSLSYMSECMLLCYYYMSSCTTN